MEVHHSHHPGHKKKWTEYLLEFLMLFLAVFLGFLAENFREHKVEKHRVKQHMHTMIENLQYDTTRYSKNLEVNIRIMMGLDSFRNQVNEAIEGRVDHNRLYYYFVKYGRGGIYGIPILNEAALSQLKSSGLIRLISNEEILNLISDYYSRRVTNLENLKNVIFVRRYALNETYKMFFSSRGLEGIFQRDAVFSPGFKPVEEAYLNGVLLRDPSFRLLSTDANQLERLYADMSDMQWALSLYNAVIRYNHLGADSLMNKVKEEYHFD